MFAASPYNIEQFGRTGTCGKPSLDYAIALLLKLGEGGYATSEIALLEAVGVAVRLGSRTKAETLLRAVLMQEGLRILETRALTYPLTFALVLASGFEARDALHLSVAALGGVRTLMTSDSDFAKRTQAITLRVREEGFQLPGHIRAMYRISDKQAAFIEEQVTQALSNISIDRAPQ